MSNKFTKKRKTAAADLDPAALAKEKLNERLRRRADRALLQRRRRKSHQ